MKQRFQQLMSLNFHTVDKMCNFILSCAVLHNLCLMEQDDEPFGNPADPEEYEPDVTWDPFTPIHPSHCRDEGGQEADLKKKR